MRDGIAVISMNNPPVNGLGSVLRPGIMDGIKKAGADPAVKALVIIGSAKAFSGGADIREFNTPKMNLPPSLPLIRDARVRAIAVTSARRLAALPEVPTVAEAGVPGYEVSTWFALFVPAATPADIVQRLNREFAAALGDADIRDKLVALGYTINGGSTQDLGALVRSELVKWARVVKESGARVE